MFYVFHFSVKVLQMDVTNEKQISAAYDFVSQEVGDKGKQDISTRILWLLRRVSHMTVEKKTRMILYAPASSCLIF